MSNRSDIQDGTGRRDFFVGRGHCRGFGHGPPGTSNSNGTPINGTIMWAPGAQWTNDKGTQATGFQWVNIGSNLSALWIQSDGSSGSQIQFGSATSNFMNGAGNLYRNAFSGAGSNPASTGGDIVVDVFTLPANALDGTGNRGLTITASGNKANNANTITAKIVFNATTAVIGSAVSGGTTIASTGATAVTGGVGWNISGQVFKYGVANSNTQLYQQIASTVGTTIALGGVGVAATMTATENAGILVAFTINCATTATDASIWWDEITGFN